MTTHPRFPPCTDNPSTVLILGARGRLGLAAARAFAQAGWRVLAQVRPGARGPALPAIAGVWWMPVAVEDTAALAAQAQGAQVSTAGSCTGGGIAEAITRIPGSSAWFEAGYVTYSNVQKSKQLAVPEALFAVVGAVSREVVEAMVMKRSAAASAEARSLSFQ